MFNDWDYPNRPEINTWDSNIESTYPIIRGRQSSDIPEYFIRGPESEPRHIIDFMAKLLGFKPTLNAIQGVPQKEGWLQDQLSDAIGLIPWPTKGAMAVPAIVKIAGETPYNEIKSLTGFSKHFKKILDYFHREIPEELNVPKIPRKGREPLIVESPPNLPRLPGVTEGGPDIYGYYVSPGNFFYSAFASPHRWTPELSPASLIVYNNRIADTLPHEWSHHIFDITQRRHTSNRDVANFRSDILKAIMPRELPSDAGRIFGENVMNLPFRLFEEVPYAWTPLSNYPYNQLGDEFLARTVARNWPTTMFEYLGDLFSDVMTPREGVLLARDLAEKIESAILSKPFMKEFVDVARDTMPPWIVDFTPD